MNPMPCQFLHALKEEHSPAGILLGNHYITITGIAGDTIRYKDSLQNPNGPDYDHTDTLENLLTEYLDGQDPEKTGYRLYTLP